MEEHQNKKPDREVVRNTEVVVQYDFSKKRNQRWARKLNTKLTNKQFELVYYEPGKAVYEKKKRLKLKTDSN